ncbi:TBC1 domain family member 22B-like isoform X2 [Gigantopelta aegis]|uniref:TBC1 domain family member 22B-like isoform X2 n=1 Tax=Gigantopelta aegis TaxID=1735272 RepID=UPI001B88E349|nr:TBC1 domain family member 22B-like isoform X2 [Gigantopelta aegis]
MSAYVPNSSSRDSKSSFWKAGASVPGSIKPVYGAQHPPMTHKPKSESPKKEERVRGSKSDAFVNFENSTSDAWDDGDDDLLQMASVQMSLRDVRSSANAVLEHHSKQINSHRGSLPDGDGTMSPGSSHPHGGGPGIGVRLNSYKTPKTSHICCVQPSLVDREAAKAEKFKTLLAETNIDLDDLRQLSWSGIPTSVRPVTWKILAGYLPPNADRRAATLERKRKEYFGFIDQYYETRYNDMHEDTFRQILKDIPRMTTLAHLMKHKVVQQIFERILFIWAIRHPASGYVQGINDLVTPFFVVFLSEYISNDIEAENCDINELPKATLDIIEADSFWCTTKLLDGIQDNYTFAQPGIQMKVNALQELIKRIDAPLHKHLVSHNVEYLQFSFRWMNNLLMREIPLRCTIRLWDTYLSEVNGFADFHLYVCASFLVQFSSDILRERDFQGILMFLQNLPTRHWNNKEISEIMAEAYKLKYMFADAPNHLMKKS